MISSNGTLVRTRVAEVSVQGRNTQGVRLIRLDAGDRLTGVEAVEPLSEEEGTEEEAGQPPAGSEAAGEQPAGDASP